MRIWPAIFIASLFSLDLALAQTPALPMFRPALVGNAPTALINRIDAPGLMKKGQKDAAIMFFCVVNKTGDISWSATYRGTPNSQLLEEEVQKKLAPATGAKMIPAVYNHQTVDAVYYGTVMFSIVKDKPRLRIFSNQEPEELKTENDFISPQPFFGAGSGFTGFNYPKSSAVPVKGSAMVKLKIDAEGNVQEATLVSEEPPYLGFGEAAIDDFKSAKFIPAFRNGAPVASEVTLPAYFNPRG